VFLFNKPLRKDIGILFAKHFGHGAPLLNYRPRIDTAARRTFDFPFLHLLGVLSKRFCDVLLVPDKAALRQASRNTVLTDKNRSTLRRHMVLDLTSWWTSKAVTPFAVACACIHPLLQMFLAEKIRQCLEGYFAPTVVPPPLREQLQKMGQNAKVVSILDLSPSLPRNTLEFRVKHMNRMQQGNAGYVLYKAIESLVGNTPTTKCLLPLVHNLFMDAIRITGYHNRLKAWMESYDDYCLLQVHNATNAAAGVSDKLFSYSWQPVDATVVEGITRPLEGEFIIKFVSDIGHFVLQDVFQHYDELEAPRILRTSILHSCLRQNWQHSHAIDCSSSSSVCTKVPLDWAARFHVFHMSVASNKCDAYENVLTYDNVPIQKEPESLPNGKVLSGSAMIALLQSKPGILYDGPFGCGFDIFAAQLGAITTSIYRTGSNAQIQTFKGLHPDSQLIHALMIVIQKFIQDRHEAQIKRPFAWEKVDHKDKPGMKFTADAHRTSAWCALTCYVSHVIQLTCTCVVLCAGTLRRPFSV